MKTFRVLADHCRTVHDIRFLIQQIKNKIACHVQNHANKSWIQSLCWPRYVDHRFCMGPLFLFNRATCLLPMMNRRRSGNQIHLRNCAKKTLSQKIPDHFHGNWCLPKKIIRPASLTPLCVVPWSACLVRTSHGTVADLKKPWICGRRGEYNFGYNLVGCSCWLFVKARKKG